MITKHNLLEKLGRSHGGQVFAIDGPNFSGRTGLLLDALKLGDNRMQKERPTAYIGPEAYNAISALAGTVSGELTLHAGRPIENTQVAPLVGKLGLDSLFSRNPFTLSGGEQVCLCICAGLALSPAVLAIDCALEQLDQKHKLTVLRAIRDEFAKTSMILVADNRLNEWTESPRRIAMCVSEVEETRQSRFNPINDDVEFPGSPLGRCCIQLENITHRYHRHARDVLENVSWNLRPGTAYHLGGANGAGKSTLSKILAGVVKPRSGHVAVNDVRFRPWRHPGRLAAYHFQNPDFQLFNTSVAREIEAGPLALGHPSALRQTLIQSAIDGFGLSEILGQHPLELPFVMRKRVALASTVASGAPWLILDEPCLGQDIESSQRIARIIGKICKKGIGVVVISHSPWFINLLDAVPARIEEGVLV